MIKPASDPRFIRLTLTSMSGPLIWALHFGAVYGGQHVACHALNLGTIPIRWGIAGATLAGCLAIGAVAVVARRLVQPEPPADPHVPAFLSAVALWLLGLSLFGILATGLAGVMLPGCASLR